MMTILVQLFGLVKKSILIKANGVRIIIKKVGSAILFGRLVAVLESGIAISRK